MLNANFSKQADALKDINFKLAKDLVEKKKDILEKDLESRGAAEKTKILLASKLDEVVSLKKIIADKEKSMAEKEERHNKSLRDNKKLVDTLTSAKVNLQKKIDEIGMLKKELTNTKI